MPHLSRQIFPFTLNIDSTAISANSNATDVINVGSTEKFVLKEMVIVSATGAFELEVTDQAGIAYQQEAVRFATNQTDQYPYTFATDLEMNPSDTFSFKFTDTSGAANRVRMQLRGTRTVM